MYAFELWRCNSAEIKQIYLCNRIHPNTESAISIPNNRSLAVSTIAELHLEIDIMTDFDHVQSHPVGMTQALLFMCSLSSALTWDAQMNFGKSYSHEPGSDMVKIFYHRHPAMSDSFHMESQLYGSALLNK